MRPVSAGFPRLRNLSPTATAVSLLLLAANAHAQTQPSFPALTISPLHQVVASKADEMLLKRLPASKGELTFRGENATRTWTIALGRAEAARTSIFQLAMLNAVSLLPERSTLKLMVNGVVVASVPAASPEKVSVLPIKIPTGVLVPGLNTIQVSTALTHRVDCSVKATYELWALLDPTQTGLLVPRDAAPVIRSIDDLALAPLAPDGTTRIHLRTEEGIEPADIGAAGHFIDVMVARAGLPRPVVEVGPALGEGPGFDVVMARGPGSGDTLKNLKVLTQDQGVTIGRDSTTDRLVVVLAGADSGDLDRRIAALAAPAGQAATARAATVEGGSHKSFADLGLATESFVGRHFMSSVDIDLPPDFYPANDRARLLIDGAHSAALTDGSELVFRVNGVLVSSLPLASGKAERFQHAVVELPLRFFHPGHNALSIEGLTSASYDQQCDLATMPRDVRLSILASSEIEMPAFARLAALPQIPAALAYDASTEGGLVNLYLPDSDRGSIGTGLTVLANVAASQRKIDAPLVHLGGPSGGDAPGIVIAAADQLPETMAATLREVSAPVSQKHDADPAGATADATVEGGAPAAAPDPLSEAAAVNEATFGVGMRSAVETGEALLRSRGFFFATDHQADPLPATSNSMLIAGVSPDAAATSIGGVELPRFVRDPAHWLVITAPTAAIYEAGLTELVASGQWEHLAGQAVSFDLTTDALRSVQPSHVTYVLPSRVVLTDIRPILGGVVSNNIVLSIGLMMVLMSILGLSTHLLIRRMGAK